MTQKVEAVISSLMSCARVPRGTWLSLKGGLPWLLIAATPALFALVTWDTGAQEDSAQRLLRFFGLPAVAVELSVIAMAMAAGREPLRPLKTAPRWIQLTLASLVAIALYTAVFVAQRPEVSIIRTSFWITHLFFGLAVYALLSSPPNFSDRLWWLMLGGLGAYFLILVAFVASIPEPLTFGWEYFGLGVVNIRQIGFYAATGAALALGLAVLHKGRLYWIAVAAASIFLGIGFWSGTRGAIVAVVAGFAAGAARFELVRGWWAAAAISMSLIGGLALSLVHAPPHHVFGVARIGGSSASLNADTLSSGRLTIWEGALRESWERPILGHGEGQFKLEVSESAATFNHPHNAILQVILDWGFVGGAMFLALMSALLLHCWHRSARHEASAPALMGGSALLAMSLYEGSLYHSYPMSIIALCIAWVMASGRGEAVQPRST